MKFWNPITETLPRRKMVEIEIRGLRNLLAYAREHSAFYRDRYADIDPEDIRTMDDVRRLPLIDKEDLRQAQEGQAPFPFGRILGVPIEEVTTFRQTSGTTGRPVYVAESCESWPWRVEMWRHILWMAGFRASDRVFLPFGYNVYVAYWEGHYAAEKLGCEVVPGGALDTRGRINKMLEIRATASLNTPTYGLYMAETARNMGVDPRRIGIRRMVCAGEPMPTATRLRLEAEWDAEVHDHIGGTEPCAWAAMCSRRDGLHTLEPYFLVEFLDLETQSREVDEGELGLAVVSPLGRRSFPLVRFNTKDVVRKGREGCECGRTSRMISEVVGRADDQTKVRGVLFTPVSVEEVLRDRFPEIAEFEIIVEKKGIMDEIRVKLEPQAAMSEEALTELDGRIAARLKMKTNLAFKTEFAAPGSLPRYTVKARRFKDLRR